jgi:hypothetical protein
MPAKLHSVLIQDEALAAGAVRTVDLPVNPLSTIWLTLRALNNAADPIAQDPINTFLNMIAAVNVTFKGSNIIQGSLRDLYVLNAALWRRKGIQGTASRLDNDARILTVPISFSRFPMWPEEAFPATRRGELQLRIEAQAAFATTDGLTLQVETDEILDAQPTRFLKYTTLTRTWPAIGQNDIDLPLGNPLLMALLFGTTVPAAAALTSSWGQVSILVDNVGFTYPVSNWETLHGMLMTRVPSLIEEAMHSHNENLAAVYAANVTSGPTIAGSDPFRNYAVLDWDDLDDGSYALQTEGRGSVRVRANADVADLVRVLPVELVALSPAA